MVDRFERIGDRESLLTARRLAREEGLLAGGSGGTAVAAALRVAAELGPAELVVVVLPDSGRNYLSKVHDDNWLRHWGFLDGDGTRASVAEAPAAPLGAHLRPADTVRQALSTLDGADPDQLVLVAAAELRPDRPVMGPEVVGAVTARRLRDAVAAGTARPEDLLREHAAGPPLTVGAGEPAAEALAALDEHGADVGVVLVDGRAHALVRHAALATLVKNDTGGTSRDAPTAP